MKNVKTKVNDLNVGKLKTAPVDSKKLSNLGNNEVVKNRKFNTLKTKVNNLEQKIPDGTTSVHINQYNTDKQNLQKKNGRCWLKKLPYTSGLVEYDCFEYKKSVKLKKKLQKTNSLITATVVNPKISEVENKIPDHVKYITQEFNQLTAETFVPRLKQANLVSKTDFHTDKL